MRSEFRLQPNVGECRKLVDRGFGPATDNQQSPCGFFLTRTWLQPADPEERPSGLFELNVYISGPEGGRVRRRLVRPPAGRQRAPMADDPNALFEEWLAEARSAEPNDPTAMALATADAAGRPSVRMVLMKGHDPRGFVFYTNLDSRKGGELAANPTAALLFHWKSLRRQVRIEGSVGPVADEEADAYFATRSRDSRLGAWASEQSRPLDSRATFEARYEAVRTRFEDGEVPRPPRWSGWRVVPERIEFWTDREHRLHERRLFTRTGDGWAEGLLYP